MGARHGIPGWISAFLEDYLTVWGASNGACGDVLEAAGGVSFQGVEF